jgi:signal peptidase II
MISKLKIPIILVVLIILIDQSLKIWIKTNLQLDEHIEIIKNKAFILFTENPGMAFGYSFGGEWGKIALTIFRMLAVIGIGWYIIDLVKKEAPKGLIISFSLIFAGAIGNIIDSAFYGMIFNSSNGQVAQMFPEGGGYGKFLRGEVVDMFYFPVINGHFPDWFPIWGSESFTFFRPVFNIADTAITVGVAVILIFHRKFFKSQSTNSLEQETVDAINQE